MQWTRVDSNFLSWKLKPAGSDQRAGWHGFSRHCLSTKAQYVLMSDLQTDFTPGSSRIFPPRCTTDPTPHLCSGSPSMTSQTETPLSNLITHPKTAFHIRLIHKLWDYISLIQDRSHLQISDLDEVRTSTASSMPCLVGAQPRARSICSAFQIK